MKKGIERTQMALYLCLVAGMPVLLMGAFASEEVLKLIGDELPEAGGSYLEFRFIAMIFSIFIFVFHSFFRGIGDTKTPMAISIIGNILMVFFTYSLTYGNLGF